MKSFARMYVWWPGINKDIEKSVRQCDACREVQLTPPAAPLNPWKWPTQPWARLYLHLGKTFLIMIDAHSKWIEAVCISSTSSQVIIDKLGTVIAKFGLPETGNGSGFTSQEFQEFLKNNGAWHTTSVPYHRERCCHQDQIKSRSAQGKNESDEKSEEPEQSNFDPVQVDYPQEAADERTTQSVSGAATTPATDHRTCDNGCQCNNFYNSHACR